MKEKRVKKYNEMKVEKRYKETTKKEQSKQVKVRRNTESEYE